MTPLLEDPPLQDLDHERIDELEEVVGHDAQTINLAPSRGGWVEFTLDQEGSYSFVTHAFGDMVKGAVGVLATENASATEMKH